LLPHLFGDGLQSLGVVQDLLGFDLFEHTGRQTSDNRPELHQLLTGNVLTLRDATSSERKWWERDARSVCTLTFIRPSFLLTRACTWPCVHCTVESFWSSLKVAQGIMETCLTESAVTLLPSPPSSPGWASAGCPCRGQT
uniref:Uncharacterized protein n=1 Tax=Takifugu rubripes TaxID=31033 RepID=A0A3B5KDG3_TAKRU